MRLLSFLLLNALSLTLLHAQNIEQDSLVSCLRRELGYNMGELRKQAVPPYFMSLRLSDETKVDITSDLGSASANRSRVRMLTPQIRIGSMELDNFKYLSQGSGSQNRDGQGVMIPINGMVMPAMRQAVWKEVLRRYQIALTNYEQAKSKGLTGSADEDKAPCFSAAPVETYYEQALPAEAYHLDVAAWKERLNAITSVLRTYKDIDTGTANLSFEITRTYLVNSDGTVIVQNRRASRVMISASVRASDGMSCPLYWDYFAYDLNKLPSQEQMISDTKTMIERLKALKESPVADPYTGPAILSGPASGVFFHEIFGHRLEGHRLKKGGQTFKKMVGEQVLPTTFNVYCDPTLTHYGSSDLNGHYLYDDEGVKSRRVNCVENGILRNFLMSRVPLEGFPQSNGHGRTAGGNDPVSRQSNLIVETTKPYTEAELRQMLIQEARRQGKAYGYYFRTVTSGFTFTGEGGSLNSFNVTPLEVYRVFTDGRPDQLVRGVDMIGTPLSMFSNITAAGNVSSTFTGMCGAESGWVPVSASSPMIYVSKIETQRRQENLQKPTILPSPELTRQQGQSEDEAILKAMDDEMQRSTSQLSYPGYPKPFLVTYNVVRSKSASVRASLGGILWESNRPFATKGSVNVSVGDSMIISDMKAGQMAPVKFTDEVNYNNIRRELWKATDYMYKFSLSSMSKKMNYLANNPLPDEERDVPDVLVMKPSEIIEPGSVDTIGYEKMRIMAKRLSAIFAAYPQLYDTSVNIYAQNSILYRTTSERIRQKSLHGYAEIAVNARVKTVDGSEYSDNFYKVVSSDKELESAELSAQITRFADRLMEISKSKSRNEYYIGPVMYEDEMVSSIFSNIVVPLLSARRSLRENSSLSSMLVGKRILDGHVSIVQLTDMPSYAGVSLLGNYRYDVNGVIPAKSLSLLDKGFVRQLLCGRYPALNCLHTTGNDRFMISYQAAGSTVVPGVLKVTADNAKSFSKMKSLLCKEAKAQGQKTAYIVRQPSGFTPCLYRVDAATGEEELVRVSKIPTPDKRDLNHISAIAKEESVNNMMINNVGSSMISPRSMIIERMEFTLEKPKPERDFPIPLPTSQSSH